VLWTLAGVSAIALSLALAARASTGAAHNRALAVRAGWRAEGCISVARARLDAALGASRQPDRAWSALDSTLAADGASRECLVSMQPVGAAADLNEIDGQQIRVVLGGIGVARATRDSLADAILDWRDEDSQPGASGAEAAWYTAAGRLTPRNGPFAARDEIHRVRGAGAVPGLHSVVGVEPGRLLLSRAPASVLASVEGIDAELAHAVSDSRHSGDTVDIGRVALTVSPESQAWFLAHRAAVMRRVTNSPDAWILTVTSAHGGEGGEGSTIELRLVRHETRAAITRRRLQ
jgi:type II secretory pathway component PulK